MSLGPFDITPEAVQSLGSAFTPFVNRLLDLEVRAAGLSGHQLATTSIENRGDKGVDAALRDGMGTDFLPEGISAWQFKRSAPKTQACADEFAGAPWARTIVENGGTYVLVFGSPLPDNLIEERRERILARAIALGVLAEGDGGRTRVYDGNRLAKWASRFPSLAVSHLFGGSGRHAVDFETWAGRRPHDKQWTADSKRAEAIEAIRAQVVAPGNVELRVQGESGIGKTRLVLEALRDPALQALVAYVPDERAIVGELLAHLVEDNRTAILVVDDCPAERHVKLVELLPADPAVRLITIGDAGPASTRVALIGVEPMPSQSTDDFLKANYGQLSPEARRFVADHSRGNMRWTIVLAERVIAASDAQAADIIARNDIVQFVTSLLPEGQDFFCSAILALLERVGWDRELRPQLEILANFASFPIEQFERVGLELEQRGLLQKQGRYRSVTPHPLAVFLAADAWRRQGSRIVTELLPALTQEMALSLFRRVAALGRVEPATSVLPRLLGADGPFSSLAEIEAGRLGSALTQLAIVLPDQVAVQLGELIEALSADELRAMTKSRRDLVWTLEKLAWHRRTFALAAASLLRLALAENETWSNNATGTWVELFGTMLPGSAALPAQRLEYLQEVANDPRTEVRLLVVRAARKAFQHHESITVSGELQGGVLVEPRGTPTTWADVTAYRRGVIDLLQSLRATGDAEVKAAAEDALLKSLQSFIADQFVGEALADAFVTFDGDALRKLRTSAERLLSLYERYSGDQGDEITAAVRELLNRLPSASPLGDLAVLLRLQRWDLGEGGLELRIAACLSSIASETDRSAALRHLGGDLPAAWEFGHALAQLGWEGAFEAVVDAHEKAPSALLGYLVGLTDQGNESAFDDFLDSSRSTVLSLLERVRLAVVGPPTSAARSRIFAGVAELPVAESVFALSQWRNLSAQEVGTLVLDWLARIATQQDYNAVVDWLNLWLHGQDGLPVTLHDLTLRLLTLRATFPALGQEDWDWAQLGRRLVADSPVVIAKLLLDLVADDSVMLMEGDESAALLQECTREAPAEVWQEIGQRLLGGSWRVQMEVRNWLVAVVPPELTERWVGDDVERARIIAGIASVGGDEPSPAARFLLEKFSGDEEVEASLAANLLTGSWMGPESLRITGQIEQLTRWRQRTADPLGVRNWARDVIGRLEKSREAVLEQEAERGY